MGLEPNKFERDIFSKISKCELNLFYLISRFKYDKEELIEAIRKREILFRDVEFSQDKLSFRRIVQVPEQLSEAFDKEIQFARNMYYVHLWHDELELNIKNDPVIQEQITKLKEGYRKK